MFLSSQYCCKHLQQSILWSRGWEQLFHCATHLLTAKETTVSTYIPVYTTDGADVCILHNMYCTLTLVRPHFVELLQYANERKKIDPQAIEDIYNGCTYKCIESALSVGSVHLSFINTDGVDILHTSDFHLWPVLLMTRLFCKVYIYMAACMVCSTLNSI